MTTLVEIYQQRVRESGPAVAFMKPVPGGVERLTWAELDQQVRAIATALLEKNLERGARCALILRTGVQFYPCALAAWCVGAAVSTLYTTSSKEHCGMLLVDCDPSVVFCEDAEQTQKVLACSALLPNLRLIVQLHGEVEARGGVTDLDTLLKTHLGAGVGSSDVLEQRMASVSSTDLATVIYTSGTTGEPKGVELTHAAWAYVSQAVQSLGALRPDDVQYFWLPMAHSFGLLMLVTQLRIGFASAVDGNLESLSANLQLVRPTFLCAVPRVFEKAQSRIEASIEAGPGWKRRLARWALAVGSQHAACVREQKRPGLGLALQHAAADALVLKQVRSRFGGRLRFFLSGGTALNPRMAEFFDSMGLKILEGWGLTEVCGVCSVNRPERYRFATVGLPIPGTEVRLDEVTSEILVRSPGMMRGYFRKPEHTREVLDDAGWLRTGDIGRWDGEFLVFVERSKDLFKTSGGRYVAPQSLEALVKAACALVGQVVVHGDGRQYCCALVTLDPDAIRAFTAQRGLSLGADLQLHKHPDVLSVVGAAVETVNSRLSSFEQIRRFAILERELSVDEGEMTASMKVRRRTIETRYRHVIESLYDNKRI